MINEPGRKDDQGKARVGLMLCDFSLALMAVAEVTTYGAEKYSDSGWLHVENAGTRYDDAKGRHMLLGYSETSDAESGQTHAAMEAWNALAKLELMLRGVK